ncbi:hypothetical protein [Paludibacterium denitrificans]|uniref:hypothetical protein n=1 Tax=Paludibacterium denitrificans TaxID=2675226 RepID=UPI001E642E7F|nr:hypothetical protein [Paludibacterium denitrificans]
MSAEQLGEVQNLQAEFDSLTQKMERQQAAEKMAAAAATQVTTAPVATPTKVPATPAALRSKALAWHAWCPHWYRLKVTTMWRRILPTRTAMARMSPPR